MHQQQLAKKEVESDSFNKVSSNSSDAMTFSSQTRGGNNAQDTSENIYGLNNGTQQQQQVLMTKTLPVNKNHSAKNANFFNNFVVEGIDQNGRTSLRQIVSNDKQGRPSLMNVNSDRDNPSSAGAGSSLKFVRKSELSQDMFENKSVISIRGDKEVSIKYGASEQMAAQIAANFNFSLTVPPQKKPMIEFKSQGGNTSDILNMSVKESMMNTNKNPMISPNTNTNNSKYGGDNNPAKRHIMTEQDPFQMSESASIVPGSDKGSAMNLMSSALGSSFNNHTQQNLSGLLWQLPYAERKSILQHQQRVIEEQAVAEAAMEEAAFAASEDLAAEEIAEDNEFALAEDTDLNEQELDLDVSRKMSIRALNVATMHRFSPGSITDGEKRVSVANNAGSNSPPYGGSPYGGSPYGGDASSFPRPQQKTSLLNRASNLLQANARKSTMNRISKLTQSRISNLKATQKQASMVSGRDSLFDMNVSVEEEDHIPGIIGMSVHRCSMIKKYNIETFFSPAKVHRRAFTTETQSLLPVPGRARFEPVDATHPTNNDQSVYQPVLPADKIEEESDEQSITEMVPEIASNLELNSDETFTYADTLKAIPGGDFLSMAAHHDDTCTEPGRVSQGRHSYKLQDSLTHSDSTVDQQNLNCEKESTFREQKQAHNLIFEQQQDDQVASQDDEIQAQEQDEAEEEQKQASGGNVLSDFVTKVPEADAQVDEDGNAQEVDLHRQHFEHTLSALHFIRNYLTVVPEEAIQDKLIYLPEPLSNEHRKCLIFDMDETLIHCVDDIETQNPDVLLEIDFPGEETVCAGINLRPYLMQCLQEANKSFQVIVFTASHQVYADAILDYIDPEHELFQYRLYRQHCVQTPEGYYVKDLRIIANRRMEDMVIVDNSVYSFAYQIDNGIPIIPFYHEQSDEEMLHLIFYLNCLATCEDVRVQNRDAFELYKLNDQQANAESEQNNPTYEQATSGTQNQLQHSVVEEQPEDEDY